MVALSREKGSFKTVSVTELRAERVKGINLRKDDYVYFVNAVGMRSCMYLTKLSHAGDGRCQCRIKSMTAKQCETVLNKTLSQLRLT